MQYDVVIVGGGPAGLAAALMLGRARKRVLLVDAGPPRNAAAEHMQNFVTRDGIPPAEFRRIGRAQLEPYESVEVRDARVHAIEGESGAFRVELELGRVDAARVLLCVGMVDTMLEIPGFAALWGKTIIQCPYCHGWELRDRALAYLAATPTMLEWSLMLRGWSRDVMVFTNAGFAVPDETRARLARAEIAIEERPIRQLLATGDQLEAIELDDGTRVARAALFAHPPQRQTELVTKLGLACDELGFVKIDEHQQTSRPGIHAAGDLTTMRQGALLAAAAGVVAAGAINHELTLALR